MKKSLNMFFAKILLILLCYSNFLYSNVTVNFMQEEPLLPSDACRVVLERVQDPQIVVWYIGESGLPESGANFYKNEFFRPFIGCSHPYKFYLYDITAWGGLRNLKASIKKESSFVAKINFLNNNKFCSLGSNLFFQDLTEFSEEKILSNYIKDVILHRDFIYNASVGQKKSNIIFKNILNLSYLENLFDQDTAFLYSPLQYLEGLFLVKEMVRQNIEKETINIVFLLANDEAKYYKDEEDSFEKDLKSILDVVYGEQFLIQKNVNIYFASFSYGTEMWHRPYIGRGKKVKPNGIVEFLVN